MAMSRTKSNNININIYAPTFDASLLADVCTIPKDDENTVVVRSGALSAQCSLRRQRQKEKTEALY